MKPNARELMFRLASTPWLVVGLYLLVLVGSAVPVAAQSSSATLVGQVVDSTGAILIGADVLVVSVGTSFSRRAVSDDSGAFVVAGLPSGRYTLSASLAGFTPTELRQIVLNVGDRVSVRVELTVASLNEGVRVVADAARLNTSPAVSTVVDRQFVENLPLNGRSFQALLELTPGVVLTKINGEDGQFSVNGQRTNANYFTVDGVSANVGGRSARNELAGQASSGQLPAMTALGGTSGLASVDAVQEFRVQTSGYAPEYGRMPGGQISIVTRSGTNQILGSVSEFFRDDALDATDWFVNNRGFDKPKLRQHNLGGVLGGPVIRNEAFFFGSYEALRLREPRTAVGSVPTIESRSAAHPFLRPYLNALPLPNGRSLSATTAEFVASYSLPSRLDAGSLRLDYNANHGLSFFGRASRASSYRRERIPVTSSGLGSSQQFNTSVTTGATWVLSSRIVHDLRVNYTSNNSPYYVEPDDLGGAVPPPLSIFGPGRTPRNNSFNFQVVGAGSWAWGTAAGFDQRQTNIVDSITVATRSHEWKLGFDFRRTASLVSGRDLGGESLQVNASELSLSRARSFAVSSRGVELRKVDFDNLSIYLQDNWRPSPTLTLTYGMRWELVPPPRSTEGASAITLDNLDDPYGGQVGLAAPGTSLWLTKRLNFAPRAGASYLISGSPGSHLLVRGGIGMFHDLGFGQIANSYRAYPFSYAKTVSAPSLPITDDVRAAPELDALVSNPPVEIWVMDRNLALPRTYQWNASIERGLGPRQTLTVGYVGAKGDRLLKLERYSISLLEWPQARSVLAVSRNRGYSDYHALQIQSQRRLQRGLQSLVSYTFGRSRDTSSSDGFIAIANEFLSPDIDFGESDYDVRHVLTGALTYQTPDLVGGRIWRAFARNWAFNAIVHLRSGLPILMSASVPFPPETESARPDVVLGQPFWIEDSNAPGGRRLNRAAFSVARPGTQGNLPRGAVRGFPLNQVDFSIQRERRFGRTRIQLRVDVFNLLNTPHFLNPGGNLGLPDTSFGLSSGNLASQFSGASSALYQNGGPRSTQLVLKVSF